MVHEAFVEYTGVDVLIEEDFLELVMLAFLDVIFDVLSGECFFAELTVYGDFIHFSLKELVYTELELAGIASGGTGF